MFSNGLMRKGRFLQHAISLREVSFCANIDRHLQDERRESIFLEYNITMQDRHRLQVL